MELLQTALTSLCSIVALFILAELMGHRQISQLTVFDYITGITIGSIAAEFATELEEPIKPLIAMTIYGFVTLALNVAINHSVRLRRKVNGNPILILQNGKLMRENMKKAKLDVGEFLVCCRQAGYFDLDQLHTAIYEYNGRMSFLPKEKDRPTTPSDLGVLARQTPVFYQVIADGQVLADTLHHLGKDEQWLTLQLQGKGFDNAREVFLALCAPDGTLRLYPNGQQKAAQ